MQKGKQKPIPLSTNKFFTSFLTPIKDYKLPDQFTLTPQPLCLIAVKELQNHLQNQNEWQHNFGLNEAGENVIGKMFGVLIVKNLENEIGYLTAFSGKLAGTNNHNKFVPPVFDLLTENGFFNKGMEELTAINLEIKTLKNLSIESHKEQIAHLKIKRKKHSIALQNKIFDQYHFLNQTGEEKSLVDIFSKLGYKNPPAGAGECAAPKLLQYAFQNQLKPLA